MAASASRQERVDVGAGCKERAIQRRRKDRDH